MLKNTLIRTVTAVVGLVLYFFVINMDVNVFKIVITLLTLFMIYESLYALKSGFSGILCGILSSSAISAAIYLKNFEALMGTVVLCLFLFSLVCILKHKKFDFSNIAAMSFIVVYITISISYIYKIRELQYGIHYLFIAFISAWISDTGAYFCGCLFGKHKLIAISPKKTIEGSIGGIVCCAIGGVIFGLVEQFFFGHGANYLMLALVCAIGSIFGQTGDLTASMIKRKFNIKDFGNIMPGHGGLTDRFDSVMMTSPYAFYVVILLNFLNMPLLF